MSFYDFNVCKNVQFRTADTELFYREYAKVMELAFPAPSISKARDIMRLVLASIKCGHDYL